MKPQAFGLVRVAAMDVAIPAELVEEIIRGPVELTPFPRAPRHVLGAFAFRGDPVPVVDLEAILRPQGAAPARPDALVVIIRHSFGRFAVLADAALGVVRAEEDRLTALDPRSTQGAGLFSQLYTPPDGGRVAVVLDLDSILETEGLRSALLAATERTGARHARDGAAPHVMFRRGGVGFAIDARHARLAERAPDALASPLSHPVLKGFHPLRGESLPVVDTAALLGLPENGERHGLLLVVGADAREIALEVDSITGMEPVEPGRLEALPDDACARTDLLRGAFAGDGGVSLVLDIETLLDAACLVDRAELFASEQAATDVSQESETRPYLVYRAGGGAIATPLIELEAVLRLPEDFTDLRGGADAATIGLASWQGRAVKILDLGALMERPAKNTGPGAPVLVARGADGLVGYLVERLELSRRARARPLPRPGERPFPRLPALCEQIRVREETRDIAACVIHLAGAHDSIRRLVDGETELSPPPAA